MDKEETEKITEQNRKVFVLQARIAEMYKSLASITEITCEIIQENFNKLYRKD